METPSQSVGNKITTNQKEKGIRSMKTFLKYLLARLKGYSKTLAKWIAAIDREKVINIIKEAEGYESMSAAEKRRYVIKRLAAWGTARGWTIPQSILNFLVEEAFQIWEARIGKTKASPTS